ncbi:hypothetical protein EDB85DRAFT_2145691 [Lactarius pseudohatsudake]|nr:hypothetical protein EDB85DRAFT_2145691 [Lactarius pseudohatsudake]
MSPPSFLFDGPFDSSDSDTLDTSPLCAPTPTQNPLPVLDVKVAQTLDHPHVAAQPVNPPTQNQDNSLAHRVYRPLTRQYAIYFDPGPQCAGVKVKFDVKGTLTRLDAIHPELGFLKYDGNLRGLDISYLEAANMLETRFYASSRVGMTEEAARLFKQFISTEYNIAFLAHEEAKMTERARRIASCIVSGSSIGPHAPM